MKTYAKSLCAMAALFLLTFVSCVDEPAGGGNDELISVDGIATVQEQINSIETSVEDLLDLQTMLESKDYSLEGAIQALEDHVASLKAGAPLLEGTLATLEQQKNLAAEIGALQARLADDSKLDKEFYALEKGVAKWIGKNFNAFYPLATAEAKAHALLSDFAEQIDDQKLYVDAVSSDVEAGLREGVALDELTALYASVVKNEQDADKLGSSLASAAEELEQNYIQVLTSAVSEREAIDGAALAKLNQAAQAQTLDVDNTLAGLISRVAAVEAELEDIRTRLGDLEADVDQLLGMIQSLTFVSEYSDDKAVAYYEMTKEINTERYAEGKRNRVPAETFDLTFLVRPAAVADALAQTWQTSLSVIGYYANSIQLHSTENIQEFQIVNAVSTTGKGLITVTVQNAFDDDFYFREKGAKLALTVESGRNNCASKFVEIVPRDITGKVYAESVKLTPETLSIQDGDTYKLVAEVIPSNVTDKGFVWQDHDSEYCSVDENGLLTATKVGSSLVEVTANATDEFGRPLTATCKVTVTPAIRIVGPQSVEIGESAVMKIESPNYINPKDVTWELEWGGNSAYLGLTDNGDATCTIEGIMKNFGLPAGATSGASQEYLPINVKCTIGGNSEPVVLMHPVCVVEVQPKVIVVEGLANDQDKMTIKIGSTYQFNTSIEPAAVNRDLFGIIYQSGSTHVATIDFRTGLLTTVGYGTANISVEVNDKTSESYFFPKRELFQKFERVVAVTVEPYWVKTMTLPATYKMAPEATTTLAPEWTTDVVGVTTPSDQKLVWSSSDPTVVSVNDTTGLLLALKEGTAEITARTAGERSVPAGQEQISSSCLVTVESPTVPINIGDYYYSDGTWSTERDYDKTVVGIIFSKVDATGPDKMLQRDYPQASHGLVLSLTEFSNQQFGEFKHEDVGDAPRHIYTWLQNHYSYDIGNVDNEVGYTNSFVLNAYREAYLSDSNYCPIFDDETGLAAQLPDHSSKTASHWYIPSYKEMSLLRESLNRDDVNINDKIQLAGGTRINTSADYWQSSMYVRYTFYNDTYAVPYSMSKGGWAGTSNMKLSPYPVRLVLAF